MKWLGALLILLMTCGVSLAQGCGPQNPNCIVPTAPVGTNNNQAASTAFVQTAIGSGGSVVHGPGASTVGDVAIWNNTTGTLLKDVTPSAFVDEICTANDNFLARISGTWGCGTSGQGISLIGGMLSVAAGVDANILNTQTANYSIQASDCSKTIQAGTGSTGQFTLTLPSVSGFSTTCSVLIKNGDTTNGKILSGFPSDLPTVLYPGQSVGVKIVNGAWATFYKPGRYLLTAAASLYVNGNSGGTATCGPAGVSTCSAGSNGNDCLTPATACLTLQNVINIIYSNVDIAGQSASVYLAHNTGTTNYAATIIGGSFVGAGVIFIIGDSTSRDATVIQDVNSSQGIQCKDLCTVEIDHVKFIDSPSTNAAQHLFVGSSGNAGHVDLNDVNFGAINSGGTQIIAGELGSAILTGPITISGGGGIGIQVAGSGYFAAGTQTITMSGTPAYSVAFAYMLNGGEVSATNTTFSGSATGPRCLVAGPLNLGAFNPNAVFPGNTDCVVDSYHGAIGLQTGSGGSSSFAYGTSGQPLCSGGSSTAKDTWCNLGIGAGGTGLTSFGTGVQSALSTNTNAAGGIQTESRQLISCATINTLAANTTNFLNCQNNFQTGQTAFLTTPFGGTLRNLYLNAGNAPVGVQTYTVTIFTGTYGSASAGALTCQMTGSAVQCSDLTHTVTVSAGQTIGFQIASSSTAASLVGASVAIELDNP